MKYALLFQSRSPGSPLGEAAYEAAIAPLARAGVLDGARRLDAPSAATTVRAEGDAVQQHPGPAESAAVAGFAVVECDEARAQAFAEDASEALDCDVEVRPVAQPDEGGSQSLGVHEHTRAGREFAFLIHVAEADRPWPGNPAFDAMMARCGKVLERLEAESAFRGTARLAPAPTAKTVRRAQGRGSLLDGPFTEARELVGGFILGVCEGQAEAVRLAAAIPGAAYGAVEVREVLG